MLQLSVPQFLTRLKSILNSKKLQTNNSSRNYVTHVLYLQEKAVITNKSTISSETNEKTGNGMSFVQKTMNLVAILKERMIGSKNDARIPSNQRELEETVKNDASYGSFEVEKQENSKLSIVDEWENTKIELVDAQSLLFDTKQVSTSAMTQDTPKINEKSNKLEYPLIFVNYGSYSYFSHKNLISALCQTAHYDTLNFDAQKDFTKPVFFFGMPHHTPYVIMQVIKNIVLHGRMSILFEDFQLNPDNHQIIEPKIDSCEQIFKTLIYWNAETLHTTPNFLNVMNTYNSQQKYLGISDSPFLCSSLKTIFCTGEKLEIETIRQTKKNFSEKHKKMQKLSIIQFYGCSEALGIVSIQSMEEAKSEGYCGTVTLGTELRIIDHTICPHEFSSRNPQFKKQRIGRILVKGPNIASKVLYFPFFFAFYRQN